jgi:hypothetical protein
MLELLKKKMYSYNLKLFQFVCVCSAPSPIFGFGASGNTFYPGKLASILSQSKF